MGVVDQDFETKKKMKAAARTTGASNNRRVGDLIREETADEWAPSIIELAGAWPDMPSLDDIRKGEGEDVPREFL